jgi:hypothetical protein
MDCGKPLDDFGMHEAFRRGVRPSWRVHARPTAYVPPSLPEALVSKGRALDDTTTDVLLTDRCRADRLAASQRPAERVR